MPLRCHSPRCNKKPYKRQVRYSYYSFDDDEPTVKTIRRYCRDHAVWIFLFQKKNQKGQKIKWTPLFDKKGNKL